MTVPHCSIDGCDKPHKARGMCIAHYTRLLRHGDPHFRLRPANGECSDWLNAHINYEGDECLTWPFASGNGDRGYVQFNGRMIPASRAMCILAHGEPSIPSHEAAHLCGKGHEWCVNPNHLAWKTKSENHADKLIHGTHSRGENSTNAKLTNASVERILLANEGASFLARHFGISISLIYRIRNGQCWPHVYEKVMRKAGQ